MIRLFILMIAILMTAAGCAGPVQTRIETQMAPTLPDQKKFAFSQKPEQQNDSYQAVRGLVTAELERQGFTQNAAALMLVHIAFADRPASIAITTGEKDERAPVAVAKDRKPLQSCDDREHRLIVSIANQVDGTMIYKGSASEYHCKGEFADSLPHLVKAALSDFGAGSDGGVRTRTVTRSGIE